MPVRKRAHYVRPELVVQVEFGEWTVDGVLRHPAYLGERVDKDPQDVVREPECATLRPMAETVRLRLPAGTAYGRVARVTTAAIARRRGFTYREVEDLRLAIDEAIIALHRRP